MRWCLVAFVCGCGGALTAQPPATPAAPPAVAATVNGEPIRLDEVDAILKKQPTFGGPLTAAQVKQLRAEVVNDLVEDLLLKQHLKRHGPKVEPAEVEKQFQALLALLRKQGESPAEYFRKAGRTEAQAREAWTLTLQFQKTVEAQATEEELRKYHAAYKDFFDRTTVKAHHIVLRVSPAAAPGERATARAKLAEVRRAILAGTTTFAAAARKYSIDPTAAQGGEVGFIARRDTIVDEAFARAAFALKPGEVSEPVEADYGVHLILVSERKPGAPAPYEKVAEEVRDCYAEDVRVALVAQLRKTGTVTVSLP